MAFRFVLQPVMATIFAVRDGMKDAQTGRSPYLWTILHDPESRRTRLGEGLKAVGRVIVLGLVMDGIYQYRVLDSFRPLEAIVMALLLAFVPYLLLRGPAARIARHWRKRGDAA
jgi:hypothetical protein